MEFRPCIDIHNGKVKQIVGGTLSDSGAKENFVSERGAGYFAQYYRDLQITGGHIIMLNRIGTPEYEASKAAAMEALSAYPGGLQVGGGINADNAGAFVKAGASHVIVTSYVFSDGKINYENLSALVAAVGREHVVLDLSCRKKGDDYYIVTDRWQKFTRTKLTASLLKKLEKYCDEYLVHAVDVEGKAAGPDRNIFKIFNEYLDYDRKVDALKVTYAGGIHTYGDIIELKEVSKGRVNITVGSALDLFGGKLSCQTILLLCRESSVSKSYNTLVDIVGSIEDEKKSFVDWNSFIVNFRREQKKDSLYNVKKDEYWINRFKLLSKENRDSVTSEWVLKQLINSQDIDGFQDALMQTHSKDYMKYLIMAILKSERSPSKISATMNPESYRHEEFNKYVINLSKKKRNALVHNGMILAYLENKSKMDKGINDDYWMHLYQTLNKDENALAHYLIILTIMDKIRENSSSHIASTYVDLAELYLSCGYKKDAFEFYSKALRLYKETYRENEPEIHNAQEVLSNLEDHLLI